MWEVSPGTVSPTCLEPQAMGLWDAGDLYLPIASALTMGSWPSSTSAWFCWPI